MSPAGPGTERRAYRAPQRQAGALATRRRIRQAAHRLFLEHGYAATSMKAVARQAGVAEKTIYLQYATKTALLKEVVEVTIVGDDEPVPAAGRQWFLNILAAGEPAEKLRLLVEGTCALHERTGPVFTMARGAAAVDPEVAVLWEAGKRGHRHDMTILADDFTAAGMLPTGTDTDWATALLYCLLGPETWHLLRSELGMSAEAYRYWLATTLHQDLGVGPHDRTT